ncbi:MAG: V-type ATP synthase subunit F [candidate division WOR-3 bacterium]
MKIAFVGPYNFVFPFKSLGAEIISSENKSIEEIKEEIQKSNFGIVFVFESVFKELMNFKDFIFDPERNIVPIPEVGGSKGYGILRIKEIVRKAVGIDIGGFDD